MTVSRIPRLMRVLLLFLGAVLLVLTPGCQAVQSGLPSLRHGQIEHEQIKQAPSSDACRGVGRTGLREVTVTSAGRRYQVPIYFPRGYTNKQRVPLLLDLHGSSSNGLREMRFSDVNRVAGRDGFLVAAPNGAVREHRARLSWNVPGVPLADGHRVPAGTRSDIRFLHDTIAQLSAMNCVSKRKVFVAGFSGGARMASALACQDAEQVSGIVTVSGLRAGASNSSGTAPQPGSCRPSRPLSVIAFHGVADRTAPYYGRSGKEWRYSVPSALREWAALNRCAPVANRYQVGRHVVLTDYPGCAARDGVPTKVQLYAIRGGGHRWPGNNNSTAFTEGVASHEVSVTNVVGQLLRDRSA
jgi:polyhydroxybutyrate depolymerase